jgi:ubiquitin C-terminal hydrolase
MLRNKIKDPWLKDDTPRGESKSRVQTENSNKTSSIKKVMVSPTFPKVDLEELGCQKWNEEIKRKSSIFNDTMMGQLLSTVTCKTCKYKSHTFEAYYVLELPLPNKINSTLKECFIEYSREEEVDCSLWVCPQCSVPRKAKKSLQIWRLPPVLAICFKRFKHSKGDIKRDDCLVNLNMVGEDLGFTLSHIPVTKGLSRARVYQPFSFIVIIIDLASLWNFVSRSLHLLSQEFLQRRMDTHR